MAQKSPAHLSETLSEGCEDRASSDNDAQNRQHGDSSVGVRDNRIERGVLCDAESRTANAVEDVHDDEVANSGSSNYQNDGTDYSCTTRLRHKPRLGHIKHRIVLNWFCLYIPSGFCPN